MDEKGLFKIAVDHDERKIVALHLTNADQTTPEVVIKGDSAEEIIAKIEELELVSRLDHAAYLGRELVKAEIALKIGKEYVQDSPLFDR